MLFQHCIATAAVYGINTAYEQRDLLPLPLLFFLHHQANSCNGKKTDKQMDKHITAIPCLGKIDNFYSFQNCKLRISLTICELGGQRMFPCTQCVQAGRLQINNNAAGRCLILFF